MAARGRHALIVGAGIGGLAAGVALQRRGWQVSIFERAAHPRELGFGLLLAPNALAALGELGVAGEIVRAGVPAKGVEVRRLDGRVIRRFGAQLGGDSIVALRPQLHGALMDAVGEGALRLSSEASSFFEDATGVTLVLEDRTRVAGDVLIGADGVRSIVRKQLHPDEPAPRQSGYAALRGVAFGVSQQLGSLTALGYLDDGIETAMARAGSDAVYWYMSLIAGELTQAQREPHAILAKVLSGVDPALRAVVSATKSEDMRFDELFVREPLTAWGRGRVTLLGDAAHPVLPHTGQGAAQALEDAVALGLVLGRDENVETALRRYEAVRIARTTKVVRLGPRIARITTTRSRLIQTMRTAAIRLIPERFLRMSPASAIEDPHRALR